MSHAPRCRKLAVSHCRSAVMSFYMYMSSRDCDDLFPQNRFDEFTIELPRVYQFGRQRCWTFSVVELFLEKKSQPETSSPPPVEAPPLMQESASRAALRNRFPTTSHPLLSGNNELVKPFILLCDLCPDGYLYGRAQPVLRVFREGSNVKGGSLYLPHYLSVNKSEVNRVRFSLRNSDLSEFDDSTWPEGQKKEHYDLFITLHFTRQHA